MCEMCKAMGLDKADTKVEVTVDGKKYDMNTREGNLEFAMDRLREAKPEVAVILEALQDIGGVSLTTPEKVDYTMFTVRDIIGSMILLKTLARLLPGSQQLLIRCFEISTYLVALPQMNSVEQPNDQMTSTTDLMVLIPKPN